MYYKYDVYTTFPGSAIMNSMAWTIIVFESKRGEKFVEELVKSLDSQTIAKVGSEIDLLEKHGQFLGMPHAKKLNSELYELRIRGKQEARIVYAFAGKKIYLLHAFKKQTQKTPLREIHTAIKRLAMIQH